jgi:hypothetical protein
MNMNTRAGTSGTRRIHDPVPGRPARALRTFGTGGAESTTSTIDAVLSDGPQGPVLAQSAPQRPPGQSPGEVGWPGRRRGGVCACYLVTS